MKFDIFCEIQRKGVTDESRLFTDTLEQARLADEMGFTTWWLVEHHGAGEYSYSAAPEMMHAWIATQTDRLRLGHAGVLAPFRINHPIRIAERAAMLDHISGGRVDLGIARSTGGEWTAFQVDEETTRDQVVECLQMIPQMWTSERFSWDSALAKIPERNIIPKPVQKPHPPLWQTTGSPASFRLAGQLGCGILGNTLLTNLDGITMLLGEYQKGLDECESPAGLFINAQRAIFTFFHVADSEKAAVESGACHAALWYMSRMPEVFRSDPQNVWDLIRGGLLSNDPTATRPLKPGETGRAAPSEEDEHPIVKLVQRFKAGEPISHEEAYEMLSPIPSVMIGDAEICKRKIEAYVDLGVDRLMCFNQIANLSQEKVLASIRNIGKHLIPHFAR